MEKTVTWKENVWNYHIPHQHWNKKKSIKLHLKNIPTMFCALLNVCVQQHVWADIRQPHNNILCFMKGLSQTALNAEARININQYADYHYQKNKFWFQFMENYFFLFSTF